MADAQGPKGPTGPRIPPRIFDEKAKPVTPEPQPPKPLPEITRAKLRAIQDPPSEQKKKREHEAALLGEGRIGKDDVTAEELASMGSLVASRHLLVLLAKKRADRGKALSEVGELLIALDRAPLVRRLLTEMHDAGRIVDIYPLEVLTYVLERRADLLDGFEFGEFILNKEELEVATFDVEERITIKLPLSLKMRAFALEGGGTPGYCLAPGMPGEYHLELGDAGEFRLLLRGDVRKKSLIDRVVLHVEDRPDRGS